MKRSVPVIILILALSQMAIAHGSEKHIMGTVTGISVASVTVETTAKKSVLVALTDKTKFEKSGSPAKLNDLKVGDRVVIHADLADNKLVANEVRFGRAVKPTEGK